MSNLILADPGDSDKYAIDWSDALDGASLVTVVHSVPTPLSKGSETNDSTTSYVAIFGGVHGGIYQVEAQATLNTGEILNRQFTLRMFNG